MKAVLFALVFSGLVNVPAWAQQCPSQPSVQRMVQGLTAAGYRVSCGYVKYEYVAGTGCVNGATYSPNSSSCYGAAFVPGPNGEAPSKFYQLYPDEALVVLGSTLPPVNYFGWQSYVYAKRNPLVSVTDPRAWIDIYAGVGPAINQLNVRSMIPFSAFNPILTAANKRAVKDVIERGISKLYSENPSFLDVLKAHSSTNVERIAVDLVKMGIGENSDILNSFLRVTPFQDQNREFDPASVSYLTSPDLVVLRVTPLSSLPATYYTLADVPMPEQNISEAEVWEKTLLAQKGVSDFESVWSNLRAQVVAQKSGPGLSLKRELVEGREVLPATQVEGRYCIKAFAAAVQTGDANQVYGAPRCLADSTDAAYIGTAVSDLVLPPGGEIVIMGVNHTAVGESVYANVSVQKPTVSKGDVLNSNYDGSAQEFLPNETSPYFYAVSFKENCGGKVACVQIPSGTSLSLVERIYLNPQTKTKPYYGDVLLPRVLVFGP